MYLNQIIYGKRGWTKEIDLTSGVFHNFIFIILYYRAHYL